MKDLIVGKGFLSVIMILLMLSWLAGVSAQEDEDETSAIPLDQLMDMSLQDLLNLEVTTASKAAERMSDAPGIITIVTKEEIFRFGGTTLIDILNRVPSLNAATTFFTDRYVIAARGDQAKDNGAHVLYLINGRPIRECLEGGVSTDLLQSFPVNLIERIEVIKGPGSVLYGSDAFSAVVNIITEKAEKTGAVITAFGGEDSAFGGSAELKFKKDDFSIVAGGRYLEKAEWETEWSSTNITATPPETTTVDITIPDKSTSFFLTMDYKDLDVTFYYDEYENQFFLNIFGATGDCTWEKIYGNISYDFHVSEKWLMSWTAIYHNIGYEAVNYPHIERDADYYLIELSNRFNISDKSLLTFGGMYDYTEGSEVYTGSDPHVDIVDNTRSSAGFYAQLDYWFLDSLKAIGGFQVIKVENVDWDYVPRIGLIWYPIEKINVKALYSEAFRAPSINEFYLNHPTRKGNEDLEPEKVQTADLSVSYLGEKVQTTLTYFHSKQDKNIYPVYIEEMGQYQNLGEITFQGFEFEAKYFISRELFLTGSFLNQSNEDEDGNEDVTPIPNFSAKGGVSYSSDRGLTLSLFDIYQGDLDDKYNSLNSGQNPNPSAYNLLSLHARFNLNQLFHMSMKQEFTIFIQGDNLLDEEVWAPEWAISPDTIPFYRGRAIYLGIDASF